MLQDKKNPTILRDAGLTFSVDWIRATRTASRQEAVRVEARAVIESLSIFAQSS